MNVNSPCPVASMSTYHMAVARADEKIMRLKLELSNAYAERNSLSFIFRLPTETLESIFIYCARDYHVSSEDSDFPNWVNVSYVCRHWRNVALNCPILWTYLFVTSEDWAAETLARSKQAPLKLRVKRDHWDEESRTLYFVEQVMNHVERIQELSLMLPAEHTHVVLSKLLSRAPCLQSLKISSGRLPSSSNLPSVLVPFDGDTPNLRTLELSHCPVPWYSFKLSGLKTLLLHDVPLQFRQSMEELLVTLSCMQDLKHLYLKYALASDAAFLSSAALQTQKVTLPRLSRLFIVAQPPTVIALLSCVNIPLQTKVRLSCDFKQDSSLDDYVSHFSLLAQTLSAFEDQAPSSPTIHSLGIATFPHSTILSFGSTEYEFNYSVSQPHMKWSRSIPLQILFNPPITLNDRDRIIGDICCSLPLTNVYGLYVDYPPLSSAFWRKLLGYFSRLRYLKLSQGDMPDLASILSVTHHGDMENQGEYVDGCPDSMFVPVLEELELDSIKFLPQLPAHDMDKPTTDVQSLYDALSARTESPGKLTMTRCSVSVASGPDTQLDVSGWWEDGHFHVEEDEGDAANESASCADGDGSVDGAL